MSGVDVAVVGSVNLDLTVPVGRVPRPGETVLGADARRGPGGKGANQAVACARLGLRTAMIGCVGEDADGGMLAERLSAEGVDVQHLVPVPAPTGLAMIILEEGDGESTIVVSPGANGRLDAGRVRAAEGTITGARAVLAQLEIPIPAVAEAVRVVRASGLPNRTDAMFTTLEGEWDEVMRVVKEATDAILAVAPRCSLVLKADIRPGVTDAMTAKVATIERHLAED